MKRVCILDYGAGNVKSVKNAFDRLEIETRVSSDLGEMRKASHLVLPGVGAFGVAMQRIQEKIPLSNLEEEVIGRGKPFLGICVGMQVLAQWGNENGKHPGLGWVRSSEVSQNTKEVKQPHIGWNTVSLKGNSPLFEGINSNTDFYFVHSYIFHTMKAEYVIGTTNYGVEFPSAIQANNIFGVQFHPEKSQKAGLRLIHNFTSF